MTLKLALFDCDGTLADSEYAITAAMTEAFCALDLVPPDRDAVRDIIGLSLLRGMERLAPQLTADRQAALADAYKDAYFRHRSAAGSAPEPLFDGIPAVIDTLASQGWQLGVATGKSQRGLDRLLRAHNVIDHFVTLQTADMHPSKPDPAMVRAALAQTSVEPARCIVIGDTSYDMAMARGAGAGALGVTWGAHGIDQLQAAGAQRIVSQPADIPEMLAAMLETRP